MFKFLMLTLGASFAIQALVHMAFYKNIIISVIVAIVILANGSDKGGK